MSEETGMEGTASRGRRRSARLESKGKKKKAMEEEEENDAQRKKARQHRSRRKKGADNDNNRAKAEEEKKQKKKQRKKEEKKKERNKKRKHGDLGTTTSDEPNLTKRSRRRNSSSSRRHNDKKKKEENHKTDKHHKKHKKEQKSKSVGTTSPTSSSQHVWQWKDNSGWNHYDQKTSDLIETHYQAYDSSRSSGTNNATLLLTHDMYGQMGGYTIDFATMVQTRVATGFHRSIRRVRASSSSFSFAPSSFSSTFLPSSSSSSSSSYSAFGQIQSDTHERAIWEVKVEQDEEEQATKSDGGGEKEKKEKWAQCDNIMSRFLEGYASSGTWAFTIRNGSFGDASSSANTTPKNGFQVDLRSFTLTDGDTGLTLAIRRTPPLSKWPKSPSSKEKKRKDRKNKRRREEDEEEKEETKPEEDAFPEAQQAMVEEVRRLTGWKQVSRELLVKEGEEEVPVCPICFCEFEELQQKEDVKKAEKEEQDQEEDEEGEMPLQAPVQLSKCGPHYFHANCIVHCYTQGFLQCPMCSSLYGIRVGTMPPGTMKVRRRNDYSLPGYEGDGVIEITYKFPSGIQTEEHPNPGHSYNGTGRQAFLPDNEEGNEVLGLLEVAWERRLLFRIGTSVTTGRQNQVTWNGIHHKTSASGGPANFGYPDETYLQRVKAELAEKGVTPADLE
ncbi:E3 ubiquitin-protein ligase dtx3l [Balamuthia mandrillaris]